MVQERKTKRKPEGPTNPAAEPLHARDGEIPQGSLDTIAPFDGQNSTPPAEKSSRNKRFHHQRHAAKLLGKSRLSHCRWTMVSRKAGVDIVATSYGESDKLHAHFEGLQTCGNVWACPCCSARISETRRAELNKLLAWARAEGHAVQMVTLTARHGRKDDLGDLLEGMKRAKRRWVQHRTHKALRATAVGTVTATEVTLGGSGWHPHFHVLWIGPEADLDALKEPWLRALKAEGLSGTGAGWSVQDASQAGRYVAKWGAAEELSLTGSKTGRAGGRTPAQLLAASCDQDDDAAGQAWREFALTFAGRSQLHWSQGLKQACGVKQVTDEEAAADTAQEEQVERGRSNLPAQVWTGRDKTEGARHFRGELLDAAEKTGLEEAVNMAFRVAGQGEERSGGAPCPDMGGSRSLDELLEGLVDAT